MIKSVIQAVFLNSYRLRFSVAKKTDSGRCTGHNDFSNRMLFSGMAFCFLFCSGIGMAGSSRVQTFQLTTGWNAVWLEVQPLDSDPAVLFEETPVDIVAAYNGVFSTRQFTSDPAVDMLSQLGWSVWYSPDREDSFLTELGAIHGQKAYLLHATTNSSVSVEGDVEMPDVVWQPSAFNLIGFSVNPLAPPTFAQFFSSSRAHQNCVIYRMVNGTWNKVLNAETAAMRSGEAFWIYCDGSSDYQGPLNVSVSGFGRIVLSAASDEVVLKNEADYPLQPVIEHIVSGEDIFPISLVVNVVDDAIGGIKPLKIPMVDEAWSVELPVLEAGGSLGVPLAAQVEEMTQPELHTLLCIKTDVGTETWLPVIGLREDMD